MKRPELQVKPMELEGFGPLSTPDQIKRRKKLKILGESGEKSLADNAETESQRAQPALKPAESVDQPAKLANQDSNPFRQIFNTGCNLFELPSSPLSAAFVNPFGVVSQDDQSSEDEKYQSQTNQDQRTCEQVKQQQVSKVDKLFCCRAEKFKEEGKPAADKVQISLEQGGEKQKWLVVRTEATRLVLFKGLLLAGISTKMSKDTNSLSLTVARPHQSGANLARLRFKLESPEQLMTAVEQQLVIQS